MKQIKAALIILIMIPFTVACAPQKTFTTNPHHEDPNVQAPEEVIAYIERFEVAGSLTVLSLLVKFQTLKAPTVGECVRGGGMPLIYLDPDFWDNSYDWKREQLMFHELGHCILDRPHTDQKLEDGCPISIMDPYVIGESCYLSHRNYYFEELFNQMSKEG